MTTANSVLGRRSFDARMISSDPELFGSLENARTRLNGSNYFFNERRVQTAPSLGCQVNRVVEKRKCSVVGGLRVEKDVGGFTIAGFFFSKYFSIIISIMGFLFLLIGITLTWTCFSKETGSKRGDLDVEKTEISEENKIIGPVCILIGTCMLFIGLFFGFVSWKVYKCDARETNYVFGNTEVIICGSETPQDSMHLMSIKSKDNELEMEPIKFFDKGINVTEVGGASEPSWDVKPSRPYSTIGGERNEAFNNSFKRNNSLPTLKILRGENGRSKVDYERSSWFPEETKNFMSLVRNEILANLRRRTSVVSNYGEDARCDFYETYHDGNVRRRSDIACFPKKENTGEFFNEYFLNGGDECPTPPGEYGEPSKAGTILQEGSVSPTQEEVFLNGLDECSLGVVSLCSKGSKKVSFKSTEEESEVIQAYESE